MIKERIEEKNNLTKSVLSGFNDSQNTISAVRVVVHNNEWNSDDKILKLQNIVPFQDDNIFNKKINDHAKKLKQQLDDEKKQTDEFDALSSLSKKLQNRVADIVKHLTFETCKKNDELYSKYREEFNLVTKKIDKPIVNNTVPINFIDV